jgi:hypothetical protein
MQGYFWCPWPKNAWGSKIAVIKYFKKKGKNAYQKATSRSDYFQLITRKVTLFQRKLFIERTSLIEQSQYGFPLWLNFPNVCPPLPLGAKDF